jgi:RNA polymerase sigma-70 factor (ECF subfamily)
MTGVEGHSAEETALALGLTVGTVYQYKSRVVARLRQEIEETWRVADG